MAEEVTKAKVGKKKTRRSVPLGQVHIQATFNNTIISFADSHGNVLAASSAGACGFRGSKKGTAYAAQIATDKAAEIAKSQYGVTKVDVFVRGVGLGRARHAGARRGPLRHLQRGLADQGGRGARRIRHRDHAGALDA